MNIAKNSMHSGKLGIEQICWFSLFYAFGLSVNRNAHYVLIISGTGLFFSFFICIYSLLSFVIVHFVKERVSFEMILKFYYLLNLLTAKLSKHRET